MRRDHRPSWLRAWHLAYERWWARRYLAPQFDALGPDPAFVGPRHIEVFGAGIRAGRRLDVLATADLPVRLTTWPAPGESARIDIGDCVLLTGGVRVMAARAVEIGDGTMLARAAVISDCDWHGLYDRLSAADGAQPVSLGRNVWIGDGAFVGKGVSIGDNSVVGARAVVTRDVPANVVAAGNPARVVKELDPDAPMRTRMDLFAEPEVAAAFFEEAWRARHGGNTFLDWLRSRVAPGPAD